MGCMCLAYGYKPLPSEFRATADQYLSVGDAGKRLPGAPHEVLLVLDGTTGLPFALLVHAHLGKTVCGPAFQHAL